MQTSTSADKILQAAVGLFYGLVGLFFCVEATSKAGEGYKVVIGKADLFTEQSLLAFPAALVLLLISIFCLRVCAEYTHTTLKWKWPAWWQVGVAMAVILFGAGLWFGLLGH